MNESRKYSGDITFHFLVKHVLHPAA